MPLLDFVKLKKLTIKAYKSRSRSTTDLIGTYEAMFNPPSFSQKYEVVYGKNQGMNSTNQPVNYARSRPRELNFKLVLDETGVNEMGILKLGGTKTVANRVKEFIDLTFTMNGDIHEPNFLVVEWGGKEDGGLIFSCRLTSVNVSYTSFNLDGSPMRAELDVKLLSDQDVKARMAKENKSSPDLTHQRTVRSGDTLTLLTKEVYGTSAHYIRVAQINNLDNFRSLEPGQVLSFPPLAK